MDKKKQITLLSEVSYQEIFGAPKFSLSDRDVFFSLTPEEHIITNSLKTIKGKVYFIFQLGVFKKKKLFPLINYKQYQFEIEYIRSTYFPKSRRIASSPSATTLKSHKNIILHLFDIRKVSVSDRKHVQELSIEYARVSINKEFLFKKINSYFNHNKIMIPSYSFFCSTISKALRVEKKRLDQIIREHVNKALQTSITNFLNEYYQQLKNEPKDFSVGEIKKESLKAEILHCVVPDIEKIIAMLEISNDAIKYYGSLIDYYPPHRAKKIPVRRLNLYVCCYLYIKQQEVHENLTKAFIFHVDKVSSKAKQYVKEGLYVANEKNKKSFSSLSHILDMITNEPKEDTLVSDLQESIFKIISKEELLQLAKNFRSKEFNSIHSEWEYIKKDYLSFVKYLRPIIKVLPLKSGKKESALLKGLKKLKHALELNKKLIFNEDLPIDFIPDYLHKIIRNKNDFSCQCYEFALYRAIRNNIESGDLYITSSISYKSFDEDLISKEDWANRENLIKNSPLHILYKPIEEILKNLSEELHYKYIQANKNVASGANPYVKVTSKENSIKWALHYGPRKEEDKSSLFGNKVKIGISDLLRYVDSKSSFTELFNHHLDNKSQTDNDLVLASIISFGTNLGLYRMSQISNLTYKELSTTSQNYIWEENLRKANDLIVDETSKLPTFGLFGINENIIHSSSDGQKFESQHGLLNTRYSSKYFGLGRGISRYSLVANHIPINAKIIGANEYEGHHVFDLIYNNSSKIKPDFHSTDTHGTNQVNFAILNFFGYQFAPRFKNINKRKLSSFKSASEYSELTIKPIQTINENLIISEWDNIVKIILSLERKSCGQAVIVQKLSSYKRSNRTKQALWEFNKIIESLYILNYIDDVYLRQNVQKALNIGESYHQLQRSVAFANYGLIKAPSRDMQNIWSESCRLITNCIIYYNSLILSEVFVDQSSNTLSLLKNKSPLAWKHINFYGNYEFKKKSPKIKIKDMAFDLLSQVDKNDQQEDYL